MIEDLKNLLKKQKAYHQVIWEITEEEGERLQLGESISSLINKKKIILSCLDEIEEKLAPLRSLYKGNDSEVSHIVGELSGILEKTLAQDLKNQEVLKKKLLLLNPGLKKEIFAARSFG